METENLKYFELNNGVLKDFDKLMSMHLDYVEELKVSEIDPNSKLLNIISLCINIKTIIIEGDQRVNTNSIVSNICKPELLEKIVLKNVKVPSGHTLKKLTGLKKIVLENIRFTNIGAFFNNIVEPNKIEEIHMLNSDFEKNSINILTRFEKIKILELTNVMNCKLEKLDEFTLRKNIEKITILNNNINMSEINNLLKGKIQKSINCNIISNVNSKIKDKLEINEEGEICLTINSANLDELVNKVNIYKANKLVLILEDLENLDEYIKPLKKVKGALSVLIKDVSQLTQSAATKIKERLKVETVDMLSADEKTIEYSYQIEDYISLRNQIETYCSRIPEELNEIEKFLKLYKILAEEITIDDNFEETTQDLDNLNNVFAEKKCLSIDFAKILQNCLACLEIESNIISGTLTKTKKQHRWNQVKLGSYWYNVDLASDSNFIKAKNILKRKSKYCLLGDKSFFETHIHESSNKNYAENDFDKKILSVFFKTGIFSDKLLKSYFTTVIQKIKLLSKINKTKALPAANEGVQDTEEL